MDTVSSILLIDQHTSQENIFGAHVAKDFSEANALIEKNKNYKSIILNLKNISVIESLQIIDKNKKQVPETQIIIIRNNQTVEELQKITARHMLFKIYSQFDSSRVLHDLQEALAEYDLQKQNKELISIIEEQNEKLKHIAEDLEQRVQKRNQSSIEASRLLSETNKYYQLLVSAFVAIQKSESILDLEKNILNILTAELDISWIRIFLENTNSFLGQKNKKNFKQAMYEKNLVIKKRYVGTLALARSSVQPFSTQEKKILNQISEALAIEVDRILSTEKIDQIKNQWQKTFDAIVDPVSIINSNYDILQANHAFHYFSGNEKPQLKCHKEFFNQDTPCGNCNLNQNFILNPTKTKRGVEKEYLVKSQKISDPTGNDLYIHHYIDISERKRAERQILESSKLSNLGLIGSSIAHELNNPLAGLITFIQILKQDLESANEANLLNDIIEMEKSALRCKDIIANLLSFTRSSGQDKKNVHISDIINKAIRVISLKSKPLGVEINFSNHAKNDLYLAQENNLTQAIVSILQNSLDSILIKKELDKSFIPSIEVELREQQTELRLDIKDNGVGLGKNDHLKIFSPFFSTKNPEQHRGLGLTIAYQILRDHNATIDLTALSEKITCARISFQRPVL